MGDQDCRAADRQRPRSGNEYRGLQPPREDGRFFRFSRNACFSLRGGGKQRRRNQEPCPPFPLWVSISSSMSPPSSKRRAMSVSKVPGLCSLSSSRYGGGPKCCFRSSLSICRPAVTMVLCLPLDLIPILIKRDSPGPVFHPQERVGKNGRLFPT